MGLIGYTCVNGIVVREEYDSCIQRKEPPTFRQILNETEPIEQDIQGETHETNAFSNQMPVVEGRETITPSRRAASSSRDFLGRRFSNESSTSTNTSEGPYGVPLSITLEESSTPFNTQRKSNTASSSSLCHTQEGDTPSNTQEQASSSQKRTPNTPIIRPFKRRRRPTKPQPFDDALDCERQRLVIEAERNQILKEQVIEVKSLKEVVHEMKSLKEVATEMKILNSKLDTLFK